MLLCCPSPAVRFLSGGFAVAFLLLSVGCMSASQNASPPVVAADSGQTEAASGANTIQTDTTVVALSPPQTAKLDPALQKLVGVEGAPQSRFRYSTVVRASGDTAYAVIVRTPRPETLREAGLPLGSVFEDFATAHWTVSEIRKAVRQPKVDAVENSPPEARLHDGAP